MGDAVHRGQAEAGTRLTEPARKSEFRPGSRTDGIAPISVAARSLAAQPVHRAGPASVAVAAIVADQLTKHVVASEVALDTEVKVLGPFSIHHVQNSGIAFGLFASATAAVIVLTLIAIGWMVGYFARSGARHPLLPVAVGLLIGGSVSNLADRVRLGHVTDFLDFRFWPAFNLADSFIVIGVAVLLGALVAADRPPRRRRISNAAARS
jgi:signal peptidase II